MSRVPRVVPVLMLPLALAAAGCGGGAHANAGPAPSGVGDVSRAPATATTATATAAATATPTGASSSSTTAAPAQPLQAVGSGGADGANPAQESGGGSAAGGPGLTPAGAYAYATKGSATSAFGNQDLSGTATLTADAPAGDRQHSTLKSPNGTQEQTVVKEGDGIHLADMKFATQGFSEEFKPSSPVLFFAWPASRGRTWTWHMTSTDGKYTLDATSTVTSADQVVAVGGKQVHTVVLHSDVKVSGKDVSFTIHQDDWVDPADSLVAKEHAVTDGTAMNTKFHSDVTRTLESTQPK